MSGTTNAKKQRKYEEYTQKYPACPCCALRMDLDMMEGHLLQDHSPYEMVESLKQFAHEHHRKEKVKKFIS